MNSNTTPENTAALPEAIFVKLTIPALNVTLDHGCVALYHLFDAPIRHALAAKGLLGQPLHSERLKKVCSPGPSCNFVAFGHVAIGLFPVLRRMDALATIKDELEALWLLPYSEIAWWDHRESIHRWWFPAGSTASMESNASLLMQWLEVSIAMAEKSLGQK